MEKCNNTAVPPSPAAEQPSVIEAAEKEEKKLSPGGRISTLMFLLVGSVFFWQSLLLYQRDSSASGYAMFPLCVSGLLLILTFIDFFQKRHVKSEIDGLPIKEKVRVTLQYLFPKDSFVFLLMSIAFYGLMVIGVPFLVASTLFLMGSMCYLIPHSFKKNLLYTVIIMVVIYGIFTLLFKVTLP